ncbi:MAG: glycosyltransferase 87 family protein [Ignavibacteriaceae bacterium]
MTITPSKKITLIISLGIFTEIFYLLFVFVNGDGNIPAYMFIYFEAFILFFAAWFVIKKADSKSDVHFVSKFIKKIFKTDDHASARLSFPILIILAGILFRVTLIPTAPATSPDVYRYIWEGRTTVNGYNPYINTPDDPQLEHLRDDIYEDVAFKHLPAIYPPFAQIIFAVSQFITPGSFLSLKIIFLLFEILTMYFLLKLLLLKGMKPGLVLLYAWLPLPIMEYFVNAHIDVVGLSFLIMFIYYLEKGKITLPAIFFALSFLTKLYPLMLIPLLIKKIGLKKLLIFLIWFAGITFLFYLPFIYKDIYVTESLVKYMQHWEFNASVYNLLKYFTNGQAAREICAILLIISVASIATRYTDFTRGVFGVFLAYIIFAATLYPWYLGWLAVLNPFAGFVSVISLFFTANFSNFTPLGEVWREYFWVLLLQYIPFFGLLVYDFKKFKD